MARQARGRAALDREPVPVITRSPAERLKPAVGDQVFAIVRSTEGIEA
jgi:molybdopterin-binding protein